MKQQIENISSIVCSALLLIMLACAPSKKRHVLPKVSNSVPMQVPEPNNATTVVVTTISYNEKKKLEHELL